MSNAIRKFIEQEVVNQGFKRGTESWRVRVGWMADAWDYALRNKLVMPTQADVKILAAKIEREKNRNGYRSCAVFEGTKWENLPLAMTELFSRIRELSPIEFYIAFEKIHPFIDGNGRTGKVLYNWLRDTLEKPEFPPMDELPWEGIP